MVVYDTCGLYFNSKTTARDRITAIEAVIDALMTTVLTSVGTANVTEFMLNDGQTTIKGVYRNPNEVISAVETLERVKQYYVNQINGRAHRAVEGKNLLINRRGFWW
jgi:hypothetical protein